MLFLFGENKKYISGIIFKFVASVHGKFYIIGDGSLGRVENAMSAFVKKVKTSVTKVSVDGS